MSHHRQDQKIQYDDPDYCNKCGEKSNDILGNCYDSSHLCEATTKCTICGFEDYWAYGFFESGSEIAGKARKYTNR